MLMALAAAAALAGSPGLRAEDSNTGELVDRSAFRVCADPSNLPFSDDQGQGFENKIAELMAQKLGVPLTYTYYPDALGFVRNTLRANRCDVIMGVVAADELVQNTNPYYRSTYVLAYRDGEGDRFGDLDSPLMQLARIGVVAGTPVADLLARKGLAGPGAGLQAQCRHARGAARAADDRGPRCRRDRRGFVVGPDRRLLGRAPKGADQAGAAGQRPARQVAPRLSHLDGRSPQRAAVEARPERSDP